MWARYPGSEVRGLKDASGCGVPEDLMVSLSNHEVRGSRRWPSASFATPSWFDKLTMRATQSRCRCQPSDSGHQQQRIWKFAASLRGVVAVCSYPVLRTGE